jgi:DNA-binding PadR family transcriptional regulator
MAMREPTFLILSALAAGTLHGYGVMGEVEKLSDGRVKLSVGTLYGALDRLTDDGLLEVEREEAVAGRLRRYYRLTDRGAAALEAEAIRMREASAMAVRQLSTRNPGLAAS